MRKITKTLVILLMMLSLFMITGCGKVKVQGVTDTEIIVGNTAAITGDYAMVGVPFNAAINAVFKEVNDAGGIGGRTIRLVHYNDEFDADKGLRFTEKLVEEDKVFALVGHFGTPTVGATVGYIQDYGVPMVYAATGINALYFEESPLNPVMAVQPIYKTDGRLMAARAITEEVYGVDGDAALPDNAKIGVIYTNDDAGKAIKEGVEFQLNESGRGEDAVYEQVGTEYSAAVQKLKTEGVQTVIIAANQSPFAGVINQMADSSLIVPVFSSYVNADATAVPATAKTAGMPIYINAWVDIYSTAGAAAVQNYVATITQADLSDEEKAAYYGNSFAIAGYIAAQIFIEGLRRVAAKEDPTLTFRTYIEAMEADPIDVPMGGTVDFSGGKRWGIASMSLLEFQNTGTQDDEGAEIWTFAKIREIETLEEILAE